MWYTVARRTEREIGVRVALGASQSTVVWMIVREILVLVALGAAAGALGAAALGRFVESLVFGLKPVQTSTTIVASVALMLAVGVLAGLPAGAPRRQNGIRLVCTPAGLTPPGVPTSRCPSSRCP